MHNIYGNAVGFLLDPIFRTVLFPFKYDGKGPSKEKIATLYENYFDRSLEKTHAETIRNVMQRSRWTAAARLVDIDRQVVHMKTQVNFYENLSNAKGN
jgi:DNA-binding transcriptional regulator YbjK